MSFVAGDPELVGSAEIQAERSPTLAAAKATLASEPATWTSKAGASSSLSPGRTDSRSIASPTVTSCARLFGGAAAAAPKPG